MFSTAFFILLALSTVTFLIAMSRPQRIAAARCATVRVNNKVRSQQ